MNNFGFVALWTIVASGTALETTVSTPQEKIQRTVRFRCREESKKRFDVEAVRVDGAIKPPNKLVDVQPEFPDFPPGTTFAGIWIGDILVDTDGLVVDAWTLREPKFEPPFPEFTAAVLKSVTKWKYEPLNVEGNRVPFCMSIIVNLDTM